MSSLLQRIKRIRIEISNFLLMKWEVAKYRNYCSDGKLMRSAMTSVERDILVASHTLEKGFSHKNVKPLFGEEVAKNLLKNLERYIIYQEADEFVIKWGVSILKNYLDLNIKLGVPKEELFSLSSELLHFEKCSAGAYESRMDAMYRIPWENFAAFAKARHSVRLYEDVSIEITDQEITNCVRIAQEAPSACNRQATRVYVVKDKKYIKKICDIQRGSSGFGKNAGALLCIVSDLRYYTLAERRLPILDAGLFMMTLVYALFDNRIGACILNASFSAKQEKEFKKSISLKPYEMLVGIVAVSKITNEQTVLYTNSTRREVGSILHFIR